MRITHRKFWFGADGAFLSQLAPENWVVLQHQLIEERLLGPMALIAKSTGVRTGIPCSASIDVFRTYSDY